MNDALLIFAKNLVKGNVKTRLAATAGNDKAFDVYKQLLQHTASVTCNLPVDKLLFYPDFIEENDCWNDSFQMHLQNGAGLGERMENAFAVAFNKGYEKVVIIGTDNPELDRNIILGAFKALNKNDVLIGPAKDGGYYLLGMKTSYPELFQNTVWSTATVFDETIKRINHLKLTYHCLPALADVDEEKDLHYMNRMNANNSAT